MNLIDMNQIDSLTAKIASDRVFYLAPEVVEEYSILARTPGRYPKYLRQISDVRYFDEAKYLKFYQICLNEMSGRSFFNLTGLGDVSIVATLMTIRECFAEIAASELFDPTEIITVFTADVGLRKRIESRFGRNEVKIEIITDSSLEDGRA